MARKLIRTLEGDLQTVKVYRDSEWNEYVVCVVGNPDADYFTNDRADAIATAELMADAA
ncbi:hypothetical protein ACPUER_11970 [Burkholderia sp. DN3021]|uniref:hypothetical protein n=1 Tax=Burkholderia sp. DN3021 TaxID=3410137 RepID=UPI003C7B7A65